MRCINRINWWHALLPAALMVLLIVASSNATGVLTPAANPPSIVSDDSQVPAGGYLPFNAASIPVAAAGCKINLAGGNMANSAIGSNFMMSCDEQDKTGSFFRIMQNDEPNHPRTLFSVRRDGFVHVNGIEIVPASNGFPDWSPKQGYGGVGGQIPTSTMLTIASDLGDTNGSALQVFGTLRNFYGTNNVPALMTLMGQVNSNGLGGGILGTKRFEVKDSGSGVISGLTAPSLSCTTSGALPANTWYVRITITSGGVESHLSPPFNYIDCLANQVPVVTAPPVGVGQTWNVYASTGANGGHGTERLQTTGSGLTLGVNWQMPNGGLSGSTIAPMYVDKNMYSIMGGYQAPGTPAVAATLYIGGKPTGGTKNAELVLPTLKATTGTRYLCIDTDGAIVSSASACSGT